ncbi:hypothetical protein DMB66_12600 [Actinoplanes sp. ATCC 53533]|uniref:hypothetical protein n=1 Tax=Actinoplanes sp. ATCC 53533 TaxID=1288362 RepID=UPI000F7B237D|nr:hypothetical protein [Actinoplanes sp. ATCC 53533]RSM68800.1 hypothetical protein DMB66_12600 [Actinoplanes sp. ATCC 53533]
MTQTMVLMGVLMICAVSGVLLKCRSRWTPGPDEPTGSYTAPTPPAPSPPPATVAPSLPRATVAMPGKPSQPLPALSVAPPSPTPPPAPVSPVRRGRNNGFARFAPRPAGARTGSALTTPNG